MDYRRVTPGIPRFRAVIVTLAVVTVITATHAGEPDRFTVVSYNARHSDLDSGEFQWEARRADALAVLRQMAPDILGLQEASERQRQDLEALEMSCIGCDDGDFSNHNAILYNHETMEVRRAGTFWLSDTPSVPESASWGNELPRWVTWAEMRHHDSAPFLVYNTHLDHLSQESRMRSIQAILSHAADHGDQLPMILMGDLNAAPDWPELELLTTPDPSWPHLPLKDVLAREGADDAVDGTYHGFDGEPEFDRIDYILISRGLSSRDAAILEDSDRTDTPVSDHFPIQAQLHN